MDILARFAHSEVARAPGVWGQRVPKAGEPEGLIRTWLRQPSPALP